MNSKIHAEMNEIGTGIDSILLEWWRILFDTCPAIKMCRYQQYPRRSRLPAQETKHSIFARMP